MTVADIDLVCSRFVLGAQRSGTTALSKYVDEHPHLSLGRNKELHYFDKWHARVPTRFGRRALYRVKFPVARRRRLVDITPAYMFWPEALRRVHNTVPDAQVVVMLRSPVGRAVSQWRLESSRGSEHRGFAEAIRAPLDASAEDHVLRNHSYVARGHYDWQVEQILELFGPDQTLLFRSEDLKDDPGTTLSRLWQHFGVDDVQPKQAIIDHVSPIEYAPSAADVTMLLDVYGPSIDRLQTITGWNLAAWLDPATAPYL